MGKNSELTSARAQTHYGIAHFAFLPLLSASILAFSMPNEFLKFGCPALGFVALVPLYLAIVNAPTYNLSALAAGTFGAAQQLLTSYWLWFFKGYAFWTLGSTTIAYLILYAAFGLYIKLFLKNAGVGRPLAFAILWPTFEFFKSTGVLGYPWGLLPYSLTAALPLLQVASITGLYGLSTLLALTNATVAELMLAKSLRQRFPDFFSPARSSLLAYTIIAVFFTFAAAVYGFTRLAAVPVKIGEFKALLVQQNAEPWTGEDVIAPMKKNIVLATEAIKTAGIMPDLIVFSESSIPYPYEEYRDFYSMQPAGAPLIPFIRAQGCYLLTGAPMILNKKEGKYANSAILINPSTLLIAGYGKTHLVPFSETIPFLEVPWIRNFMEHFLHVSQSWAQGRGYEPMKLPVGGEVFSFGTPICFEDAFTGVCREFTLRGADLLINLTDNSWSKTGSAEIQHWAAARFRAIEFNRTLLRSTNSGLSCVIDPLGRNLDELPLFTSTAKIVWVPVFRDSSPTPILRFGEWYACLCLLLSATLTIILVVKERNTILSGRRTA